jgi:integrase
VETGLVEQGWQEASTREDATEKEQDKVTQERRQVMGSNDSVCRTNQQRDNDGLHKRRRIWHFKLKVGGRWKEISTRTSNYSEARVVRRRALQAQEDGQLPSDMSKWPFEKAAARWLAVREKQVLAKTLSVRTYESERYLLRSLSKGFDGKRLSDITSHNIEAYRLRRARTVSPRTINVEMKILRMILRRAKLWTRRADDYKPLPENKRGPGRALSPEEEKRLFEIAAGNPEWEVVYNAAVLEAHTTARSEEIRGLRLADVDPIDRTITIRRSTTRTDASCRIVPLDNAATWALVRLIERARMIGATVPEHYLFPFCRFRQTKTGESTSGRGYDSTRPTTGWRSAWELLREKAGPPWLRFHDLRHHCITRLAESGAPDHVIMSIAGHVSKEMLEHYSHIRMEAKRTAVAALDQPGEPEGTGYGQVAVN